MGIYGHRFDNLIQNNQVLTEGKFIDFLVQLHKDYKEYKQEEKIKKEIVKKYMKQGMNSNDAYKAMFKELDEQKRQIEEKDKKEKMDKLDLLYSPEEKTKIKEIQSKIRSEFGPIKSKYFKPGESEEGVYVDLELELYDFFTGATEEDFCLGSVYMIGGYEIEADDNREFFDNMSKVQDA